MICITCAECGESFEIGEEFAGVTEFCPACGALNDIPDTAADPGPDQPIESAPAVAASAPVPGRGIPAALWWTILIAAVGLFAVACVFLFSDNWESRNVQALADAANRGDVLMADEDYAAAAGQYRFVLDTVGHRAIESVFIRQLIDRARRGEAEAEDRLHATPTTLASTEPASGGEAFHAATQPDLQVHLAIKSFQRDYEAFPSFIRGHPLLFQDAKGNWRRRQFVVWDASYDPPAQSDSPRILLRYTCGSHVTEPHHDRQEAEADDNFPNDESPKDVHCQTQFEWLSNRWLIARRDADAEKNETAAVDVRPSLDDFYVLERQAFHANQASP